MSGGGASQFGYGQQHPWDGNSDYSKILAAARTLIALINVATPVKVVAVDASGGIAPAGTVDVLPLVSQIDGIGNATPHSTVFGLTYFRLQGGDNAVIIDPKVGDVGFAVFADRDISAVKAAKAQALPGSRRRFSLADGVYLGAILREAPKSYIWFAPDGTITMSPDQGTTFIKLEAGKITLSADEIITHANVKNCWDADGTGFVYQANQIDTYTQGVTTNSHPPHPPEVPT